MFLSEDYVESVVDKNPAAKKSGFTVPLKGLYQEIF
jgi:hypothetical protein